MKPGSGLHGSSPTRQLTLSMQPRPQACFDNFHAFGNQRSVTLLREFLAGTLDDTLLVLVGGQGAGKSHLLQAAMHELECSRIGARYFGLSELRELSGELDPDTFFDGVEESAFVLLDDLDCWLPDPMHERMLFNLYNQFRISGQKLVVSSAQAPRQIRLTLPDLQSRLNSGLLLSLAPLDDAQKTCLLQYWSTERGFALTGDAAAYILSRSGRSVQELRSVIDQLDHASLTEKNRVTMPFIKKTFGW